MPVTILAMLTAEQGAYSDLAAMTVTLALFALLVLKTPLLVCLIWLVFKLRRRHSGKAASRGLWADAWHRFLRKKMAVVAALGVLCLIDVAIFAPAYVGTRPIVCYYKGNLYFPALGYFVESWENPIFITDEVIQNYPTRLQENDPQSWAVWPLVYQDPYRRVYEDEWPGRPGNPVANRGAPNRYNLLGTTESGKDVFAMIVHGTRIALLVGFVSTGIAALIGILIGSLAGYFGGWLDMIASRMIEVMMCIPPLILILALIAIVEEPTIWHIMAVIGVTGWTRIARLTRAEFLKLKGMEYVTAARSLGASWPRMMFRHILPNSLASILVPITFGIAAAILVESTLRFLGIGGSATPSWGTVLNEGRPGLLSNMWWLILFPGGAIFLTVLAYNVIGEGIQEATDPKLREAGK